MDAIRLFSTVVLKELPGQQVTSWNIHGERALLGWTFLSTRENCMDPPEEILQHAALGMPTAGGPFTTKDILGHHSNHKGQSIEIRTSGMDILHNISS